MAPKKTNERASSDALAPGDPNETIVEGENPFIGSAAQVGDNNVEGTDIQWPPGRIENTAKVVGERVVSQPDVDGTVAVSSDDSEPTPEPYEKTAPEPGPKPKTEPDYPADTPPNPTGGIAGGIKL